MRETVDFKIMMKGLLVKPASKNIKVSSICSKKEHIYEISNLGFEGMQIRSFFKPDRAIDRLGGVRNVSLNKKRT